MQAEYDAMREIDVLCGQLRFGEIDSGVFIERCLEIVCRRIDCSRSGLWLFAHSTEGRRALLCVGMYDRSDARMIAAATNWADVDEAYFAELANRGKVVANDVRSHPVTARHFETYFRAQDIRSFLALACSLNGRICGAFTCSSIGASVEWSGTQISILSKIGARATVALADRFPAASHVVTSTDRPDETASGLKWGCF